MLRSNQLGKEGHPFLRILFGDDLGMVSTEEVCMAYINRMVKPCKDFMEKLVVVEEVAGYSEVVVVVVVLVVGCVWLSLLPIFIIGNGDRCRTLAQGSSI